MNLIRPIEFTQFLFTLSPLNRHTLKGNRWEFGLTLTLVVCTFVPSVSFSTVDAECAKILKTDQQSKNKLIRYDATDFEESKAWKQPNNRLYGIWSAQMANFVYESFDSHFELEPMLTFLGEARLDFQQVISHPDHLKFDAYFGMKRPRSGTRSGWTTTYRWFKGNNQEPERVSKAFEINPSLSRKRASVEQLLSIPRTSRDWRTHWIEIPIIIDNRAIAHSLVNFTDRTMTLNILFPPGGTLRLLIQQLEITLYRLLLPNEANKLELFAQAMHYYFIATPYFRGSASIGRALFAGIFLRVFSQKILLNPDIDLYAQLLSTDDFVAKFLDGELSRN